jgi:hypothetical protein
MSSDLQEMMTLKELVGFAMDECKVSEAEFDPFWLLAFRALVDLMFDVTAQPQTFRVPMNGNKTANFPSGCISWTKIGILNDKGEVSTIQINNALTTFKDTNPNRLTQLTPDINDALPVILNAPFYVNYYYDGIYQPLFGIGGGLIQYGSCRVDEENRVVILDEDFKYDHIIFECIVSPEKNGDYRVPTACLEAVVSFIKWKSKMGTRVEYMADKINARRRMPKKKVTLQNINQVIRESEAMKLRS